MKSQSIGLSQVLAAHSAEDGTNTYLYGLDRIGQNSATGMEYFLPDALGSVRNLTSASGAVSLTRSYDPYGSLLSSTGSGTTSYGFAGEWTDETGLQHLRARFFHVEVGRFISRDLFPGTIIDPITLNRYQYSRSNPILFSDPSGLDPFFGGRDESEPTPPYWISTHHPSPTLTPTIGPSVTPMPTITITPVPTAVATITPSPTIATTPTHTPTVPYRTTPGTSNGIPISLVDMIYDNFLGHYNLTSPSSLYPYDPLTIFEGNPYTGPYTPLVRFSLHIIVTGGVIIKSCYDELHPFLIESRSPYPPYPLYQPDH